VSTAVQHAFKPNERIVRRTLEHLAAVNNGSAHSSSALLAPKLAIHVRHTDKISDRDAYSRHALQHGQQFAPLTAYALQVARLEQSTGVTLRSYALMSDDAAVYSASTAELLASFFRAGTGVVALHNAAAVQAVTGQQGGHVAVAGRCMYTHCKHALT
jgi:hypothetical protein